MMSSAIFSTRSASVPDWLDLRASARSWNASGQGDEGEPSDEIGKLLAVALRGARAVREFFGFGRARVEPHEVGAQVGREPVVGRRAHGLRKLLGLRLRHGFGFAGLGSRDLGHCPARDLALLVEFALDLGEAFGVLLFLLGHGRHGGDSGPLLGHLLGLHVLFSLLGGHLATGREFVAVRLGFAGLEGDILLLQLQKLLE